MHKIENQYAPDYVSPPGETLLDILEDREMSQAELARRMGRPNKTINEIVQGKAAITAETALQLERVLGISAQFWNTREQQYRDYLARQAEYEKLSQQTDWLKKFPIKALIKSGSLPALDDEIAQLQALLKFFGMASPEQWNTYWSKRAVAFRKTAAYQSDLEPIACWLRQGEIEAQQIDCQPYDAIKFRQALQKARQLTLEPPEFFHSKLVNLCAEAGVAVVFIPQLPKARVSGVTQWLSPKKALIQLSLRYKTNDHLWFTFFHEAGHILLHSKRKMFLDEKIDQTTNNPKETEANEFAANILIPPDKLAKFIVQIPSNLSPSKVSVQKFAEEIGIAPGIVVGRLQHDGYLEHSHCNNLKQRFSWPDFMSEENLISEAPKVDHSLETLLNQVTEENLHNEV